jgi:SpoVK/Ycf46/Vps4 family AAA+-type ATPase
MMGGRQMPIVDVAYSTPEFEEALGRLRGGGQGASGTAVVLVEVPAGMSAKMATDVAERLGLDLYRIDQSAIAGKFIGETEKNIDRLFARAERSNALLFFDEADALFGKRTDVDQAHDRFADIEVSYLLQRLETYAGLMIMAMNTPEAQERLGSRLRLVRVRYRAS